MRYGSKASYAYPRHSPHTAHRIMVPLWASSHSTLCSVCAWLIANAWHQDYRLNVARYLLLDVRYCARSRKHVHTFWNRAFTAANRCNLWQIWHPYHGLNHWSLWEQVGIRPFLPIQCKASLHCCHLPLSRPLRQWRPLNFYTIHPFKPRICHTLAGSWVAWFHRLDLISDPYFFALSSNSSIYLSKSDMNKLSWITRYFSNSVSAWSFAISADTLPASCKMP